MCEITSNFILFGCVIVNSIIIIGHANNNEETFPTWRIYLI